MSFAANIIGLRFSKPIYNISRAYKCEGIGKKIRCLVPITEMPF